MRRIIPTIILCSFVIAIAGVLTMPSVATAVSGEQDPGKIETRLQVPIPLLTTKEGNITVTPRTLAEYIIRIYNFLLMAATVIATVMLVWGGFMWMTAGGGAERVGKAQEYIWNAIAGLVILFGAYLILSIVNPSLTTLKSLSLQPIEPVALGLFCDERVKNNAQLKGHANELQFILVQTSRESSARTISSQRFTDPSTDAWITAETTKCGSAYAVSEIKDGKRRKGAGEPCLGRTCDQGKVCNYKAFGQVEPTCVKGVISGRIIFGDQNSVAIWLKKLVLGGPDPSKSSDTIDSDEQGGSYILGDGTALDDATLYYLEVITYFGHHRFYVGKDGKRIVFNGAETTCSVVKRIDNNNNLEEYSAQGPCSEYIFSGRELKTGVNVDIDISNPAIFSSNAVKESTEVIVTSVYVAKPTQSNVVPATCGWDIRPPQQVYDHSDDTRCGAKPSNLTSSYQCYCPPTSNTGGSVSAACEWAIRPPTLPYARKDDGFCLAKPSNLTPSYQCYCPN